MAEAVTDRRIASIRDFVQDHNWKQALKECEKWHKKGEKSDRFLALQAFVLSNHIENKHQSRAKNETLLLCHRTTPVTDLQAIDDIQGALKRLSLAGQESNGLWERAAVASVKHKDLWTRWLNTAVNDGDWRSAQKATTGLRNAFPNERQYEFWNILMCFLISKDDSALETERRMFGLLAYRMIEKAAEAVPEETSKDLASGKAIATFDELELLVQIYVATDNAAEALSVLQSDKLGSSSSIFQQDSAQGYHLVSDTLLSMPKQQLALEQCENILRQPEMQDSDDLWRAYVQLQTHRIQSPVGAKNAFEPLNDPASRAAQKARMQVLCYRKQLDQLQQVCQKVFLQDPNKRHCFDDLEESFQGFDQEHLQIFADFLEEQTTDSSYGTQLFRLKFERCTAHRPEVAQDVLRRHDKTLSIFSALAAQETTSPELLEIGLLAAMDLLRAAAITKDTAHTMRAALLLELCRTRHPAFYPYSLLLLQCYLSLGLISLAMAVFDSLSVKNVQWESTAWILLSRISTLHPHRTGSGKDVLNPLGALDGAKKAQSRSQTALNRGTLDGLRNGAYANVINSTNARQALERSLNIRICTLEERRIYRLISGPQNMHLEDHPMPYVDQRDLSIMPHTSQYDLDTYYDLGPAPLPRGRWADIMAAVDHATFVFKFAIQKHTDKSGPGAASWQHFAEVECQRFEQVLHRASAPGDFSSKELTASEETLWRWITRIGDVALKMVKGVEFVNEQEPRQQLKATLQELVDKSAAPLSGEPSASFGRTVKVDGLEIPGWEFLHTSYLQLEICQVYSWFLHWISHNFRNGVGRYFDGVRPRLNEDYKVWEDQDQWVSDMCVLVGKVQERVYTGAHGVKHGFDEGGVLGKLVDVVLGRKEDNDETEWTRVISSMADEAAVEEIIGRWMDSWRDGLDGIGKVKRVAPRSDGADIK